MTIGEQAIAEKLAAAIDQSRLCIRIVKFFLDHPNALDALEGIADWWIQEDRWLTREALDRLVALMVVVRRVHGGREIFSFTADTEMQAMLRDKYGQARV